MFLAAVMLVQAAAQCTATDAGLPGPLSGWTAPGAALAVGKAMTVPAGEAAKLAGVPAGAKPGGAALVRFSVNRSGRYGIALDQAGWTDVVPGASGGTALKSVAHGHGPQCSTIRKIVRFDLRPGNYRVYLTGLQKPSARLMLVAPD